MSDVDTKCKCGRPIRAQDITQHGFYLRLFGPYFAYFKSQCPECGTASEYFIGKEQWERDFNLSVPVDDPAKPE